jgi:nucleobase:cation symporter-1, NCS1 family
MSADTDSRSAVDVVHAEAPNTLTEAAPRALSLLDQLGFWGNLGVSLFGLTLVGYTFAVGDGHLSLTAATTALLVGTLLGGLILGVAAMVGASTGAPAMVLLRGLLGAKASWLPTGLNIAQNLGWGIYEIILIATSLRALTDDHLPRWLCVVLTGVVTTGLTIRPLGAIRVIRKYVSVLVVIATVILAIGLLRRGVPHIGGSWSGFLLAVDAVIALSVSWVPLAADYSRHSRTEKAAFTAGFAGYGLTQIACMVVGLLALIVAEGNPDATFSLFTGLPLGLVAMSVLVLRETDQSFANVYSTAVSVQNLRPRWDRRVLTLVIGTLVTVGALTLSTSSYQNFLYLIGAVFVPMSGVLFAGWRRTRAAGWDVSENAPVRPGMLAAWLAGFVAYQLISPTPLAHWSGFWTKVGEHLHTVGHTWLSASLASFIVALLVALPFAAVGRNAVTSNK